MPKVPTVFVEVGQRFGRLVVVDPDARSGPNKWSPRGRRTPVVRCSCGVVKNVAIYDLLRGFTTSCGCLHDEKAKARFDEFNADRGADRGGASQHREFDTWQNIRSRCLLPHHPAYHRYGGRGITIHPHWVEDAWAFCEYLDSALGPRPDGMSLDRIDNDSNYEPGNLRWATQAQQMANQERRK